MKPLHRTLFVSLILPSLLALQAIAPALAAPLQETVFIQEMPTRETVQKWNQSPVARSYRISGEDPTRMDLEVLNGLIRFESLEIGVSNFPYPSEADAWKKLAARGAQLNVLTGYLPGGDTLKLLDSLGFSKILFVITAPQDPGVTAQLAGLKSQVSITYATRAYPRYMDRPSWDAIPARMPLTIATDYWPLYLQMDFLNLLAMPKNLMVKDIFPQEENFPYLLNIRSLNQVVVDTDFDPSIDGIWEKFGKLPVRWNRRGALPSEDTLTEFARSQSAGPRSLTVDTDIPLTREERTALEKLPIPVRWLHEEI